MVTFNDLNKDHSTHDTYNIDIRYSSPATAHDSDVEETKYSQEVNVTSNELSTHQLEYHVLSPHMARQRSSPSPNPTQKALLLPEEFSQLG